MTTFNPSKCEHLLNKYVIEKEIGSGANGCVLKARYIKDLNVRVAIKKINLFDKKIKVVKFLKKIQNEVDLLKSLSSPYIISFIDYHCTPK